MVTYLDVHDEVREPLVALSDRVLEADHKGDLLAVGLGEEEEAVDRFVHDLVPEEDGGARK